MKTVRLASDDGGRVTTTVPDDYLVTEDGTKIDITVFGGSPIYETRKYHT